MLTASVVAAVLPLSFAIVSLLQERLFKNASGKGSFLIAIIVTGGYLVATNGLRVTFLG